MFLGGTQGLVGRRAHRDVESSSAGYILGCKPEPLVAAAVALHHLDVCVVRTRAFGFHNEGLSLRCLD